jgi:hypothetical protein
MYTFPIVPGRQRDKNDAVSHLLNDGSLHVFNTQIIEAPVRAGLCLGAPGIGAQSGAGNGGQTNKERV